MSLSAWLTVPVLNTRVEFMTAAIPRQSAISNREWDPAADPVWPHCARRGRYQFPRPGQMILGDAESAA